MFLDIAKCPLEAKSPLVNLAISLLFPRVLERGVLMSKTNKYPKFQLKSIVYTHKDAPT
jgi:hypothetical protein